MFLTEVDVNNFDRLSAAMEIFCRVWFISFDEIDKLETKEFGRLIFPKIGTKVDVS